MAIHSVPAHPQPAACENGAARAHPRLRGHVLGYGGFRSGAGHAVRHRLLPIGFVTLILDPDAGLRVTGARTRLTEDGPTTWGCGVTVGLGPAGVPALLGVPMRALAGEILPLSDVIGARATELGERLAAADGWTAQFAVLDDWLHPGAAKYPDRPTVEAWQLLSHPPRRVGEVAAKLGIGRRLLERNFAEYLGMSPGTVARLARFQRAVDMIGRSVPLAAVAAGSGYADQPHLTRETRELTGATPGELRAFVQYRPPAAT